MRDPDESGIWLKVPGFRYQIVRPFQPSVSAKTIFAAKMAELFHDDRPKLRLVSEGENGSQEG